jgi:hypothetical protein
MPLNFARDLTKRILRPTVSKFRIREFILPGQEALRGNGIRNKRILYPAQRVLFASPESDSFVPLGKYYQEGWVDRPDIFVCEIPDAYVHLESGLICTPTFKALVDSGLEHRLSQYRPFGRRRPMFVKKLRGTYSTISYCFAGNFWHWMIDCLPKIHSLARVAPASGLTLLMPASANEFQRETLRCILPEHFKIEYIYGHEWLQTELFVWPSLVSDRCMGFLPNEYYEAIRNPIFQKFNLPAQHTKTERLYISRQGANHRQVRNEDAVMQLLDKFGFRKVALEKLSFAKQVELFHQAEIVIGAHGAGVGTIFFSGDIEVVVLYPTRIPPNYFHSLALGLGQKHHFVCHDESGEDDSFDANIPALERILGDELGLKPSV